MLKALYEYSEKYKEVNIPIGFEEKSIKAYILLSKDGDYLGIEQCGKDGEQHICPDLGSDAQGTKKCNPFAEKKTIILHKSGEKTKYFLWLMDEAAQEISVIKCCLDVLKNSELFEEILQASNDKGIKEDDVLSFKVDGEPITELTELKAWWKANFRKFKNASVADKKALCLITRKKINPMLVAPKTKGLTNVGGSSTGVSMICFDKSAFCSYGLDKAENAPVSEEVFNRVKNALNDLLKGSPAMYKKQKDKKYNITAPVFSGMKFVHWYDCPSPIEVEENPILSVFGGFDDEADEDNDEATLESAQPEDNKVQESLARREADKLIASVKTGENIPLLDSQYHIMLISGVKGRVKIRYYENGNYSELQKNLECWNKDIALRSEFGNNDIPIIKLKIRLNHLVAVHKKDNKSSEELSGIISTIVIAIIHGTPLPDAVAAKALYYIRSKILSSEEENEDSQILNKKKKDTNLIRKAEEKNKNSYIPDGIACQWLKAWLVRKGGKRKEEVSEMKEYNAEFSNGAYHAGALFAIYVDLQKAAMKEVNAGIVQRYYASASRMPLLVIGTLEKMAQIYLSKLEWDNDVRFYEEHLNEEMALFKDCSSDLPRVLGLEEQSYFAIGYRQMCVKLIDDKKARKSKNTNEN